jgi:hypothetical protein
MVNSLLTSAVRTLFQNKPKTINFTTHNKPRRKRGAGPLSWSLRGNYHFIVPKNIQKQITNEFLNDIKKSKKKFLRIGTSELKWWIRFKTLKDGIVYDWSSDKYLTSSRPERLFQNVPKNTIFTQQERRIINELRDYSNTWNANKNMNNNMRALFNRYQRTK